MCRREPTAICSVSISSRQFPTPLSPIDLGAPPSFSPLPFVTHHATPRLRCLGLAVELIPVALDIIQPIHNHDAVPSDDPLHGRHGGVAGRLLGPGIAVHGARHAEAVVADDVQLEARGGARGRRGRDLGGEEGVQLGGAVGFPGAGVAGEDNEL